jgi:hypothetical protein
MMARHPWPWSLTMTMPVPIAGNLMNFAGRLTFDAQGANLTRFG